MEGILTVCALSSEERNFGIRKCVYFGTVDFAPVREEKLPSKLSGSMTGPKN